MKSIVLAVRDQQSDQFTQPITAHNKAVALRSWGDSLNDPQNANSEQVKHPEHFALWYIGEYDSDTGTLTPAKPEQLAVGTDLIIKR